MPCALTLVPDDAAQAEIGRLCVSLARLGIAAEPERTGYAPHITLAVFEDAAEGALAAIARGTAAFHIGIGGIGIFPGTPAHLWLAPAASEDLIALHAAVLRELNNLDVHAHYRTGAWTPHVTLCSGLSSPEQVAAAARALLACFKPFRAGFERMELVRFPPVAILASTPLAAGGPDQAGLGRCSAI